MSKRQYCTRKKTFGEEQFFRTDKLTDIEKSKGEYQEPKKYPLCGLRKMKHPRKSTIAAIGAGNW